MKNTSVNQAKYDKDHTVRYSIKLNKTTDSDIIHALDKVLLDRVVDTRQGAIKYLLRKSGNK